jgi:UDP-N-acetylmuramoyl-L-alanyl-D-glutamate--2,6-diaminopimelate ligase
LVFGCDGATDTQLRHRMGEVAEAGSDLVVLTDDNPGAADADAIMDGVRAGMTRPEQARVQRQRGLAIRIALTLAGRDDCVLIAGKGHETIQDMGDLKVRFSDRAQAVQALSEWTGGRR